MKRDIASTFDVEELNAPSGEQLGRRKQVAGFGGSPKRNNRRVFDEQQNILRHVAGDAGPCDAPLHLQRVGVRNEPQPLY